MGLFYNDFRGCLWPIGYMFYLHKRERERERERERAIGRTAFAKFVYFCAYILKFHLLS